MSEQRVEVYIEELVLHGFPPLDAPAVGEAVQRELAARLRELPLTGFGARAPFAGGRDPEPIRLAPDAMVQTLAGGLADAISRRMHR